MALTKLTVQWREQHAYTCKEMRVLPSESWEGFPGERMPLPSVWKLSRSKYEVSLIRLATSEPTDQSLPWDFALEAKPGDP